MRIISTLLFALLVTGLSFGQTTYWQEDFANGPKGWTVETSLCGDFSGDIIGQYALASVMQDGSPVAGVEGSISFSTFVDYSAKVIMNGVESLIQGGYSSGGNIISTNTTGATFTLGGATDYMADGSQTAWFANISLDQATLDAWGATALGMGNPTYAFVDGNLIITSTDGATVLTYSRTSSCGEYWKWSHNGDLSNGLVAAEGLALESPTISNGCMALNADFYITQGVNNPGAPPYPQFIASLTSPTLDFSEVTEAVAIEFTQLVRTLNVPTDAPRDGSGNSANTSVSVSIDGGDTWSDPVINVNPSLAGSTSLNNTVKLPLVGLQGQNNVKIRLTYAQDFYYWAVDDISIVSREPYDMGVNSFFAIMPNAITPQSQLEPVTFEADIQNFGGRTAENVNLNLTIADETGTEVYNSDKPYGNIDPDVLAENSFFDEVFDPANLEIGTYTGIYSVTQDSTDSVPGNDTQSFDFMVSDTIMSKDFTNTRNVAPGADNTYSYGNCYYIPNGGGLTGTQYMWFGVANADELAGQSITTFLYKWDGDVNGDLLANQTEYHDPVAFNSYTFDGTESDQFIKLPIDIDGAQIPLEDDSYYIILISYVDITSTPCYLLASEQFDYSATNFVTDSLQDTRYAAMLSVGEGETDLFARGGFGLDIVPSIPIDVKTITSTKEPVLNSDIATISPNPAATTTMITINQEDVGDITVSLVDMSGKILLNKAWNQTSIGSTLSLNVNQYPSGRYTIRLRTDEGIIVKPLVITK